MKIGEVLLFTITRKKFSVQFQGCSAMWYEKCSNRCNSPVAILLIPFNSSWRVDTDGIVQGSFLWGDFARISLFFQAVCGHMDIPTGGKRVSEHFVWVSMPTKSLWTFAGLGKLSTTSLPVKNQAPLLTLQYLSQNSLRNNFPGFWAALTRPDLQDLFLIF